MINERRYMKLIFSLFILFLISITFVNAEECTFKDKSKLKDKTKKIEIVPDLDTTYDPMHSYSYRIRITNLTSDFYIKDSQDNFYDSNNGYNSNIKYGNYTPNSKVVFTIYATSGICADEKIDSYTIKFDAYNDYSQKKECKGYEDFTLCKRTYSGTIESDEFFYKELEIYKKNLKKTKKTKKEEKDNTKMYIIAGIAVAIVIATSIIVIVDHKKEKKKIKIKLDDKE